MALEKKLIVLIAPNVSEQKGGEGIKALQIFEQFRKIYPNTIQITHARNRAELDAKPEIKNVMYVEDSALSIFLWKSYIFRWFIDTWFSYAAVTMAEKYVKAHNITAPVILHQTEPNSPVVPRALSRKYINVFGPINGNIYYPPIFRDRESLPTRIRRLTHFPLQKLNRLLPFGLKGADLIFSAGGRRTSDSLKYAGCSLDIIEDSLDCGIDDKILEQTRVIHASENLRFVHYGRLVFHKGTALLIKSLKKTKFDVTLDIIGSGPELENCKRLTIELGLAQRVNFRDWFPSHDDLLKNLHQYRGLVLPSMEDANGIVVQEAMALGLPCICLDWGGPQLLVKNGETGYLVAPESIDFITTQIASHMDRLSQDSNLAEQYSIEGRRIAQSWRWSEVATEWINRYPSVNISR